MQRDSERPQARSAQRERLLALSESSESESVTDVLVFGAPGGLTPKPEADAPLRVHGACAAMLADVPMGESPIGGVCSVATVVISDRGKGDRPVGKLGGKSLRWLGKTPVRSARETSNSTGRRESEPVKPRKPSARLKRMMGNLGSAEP